MEKNLKYYLDLPYTRELIPEPEGGWFVRIKELPGCMSQGDTPEEAMEMISDAMEGWLEVALEHGQNIPEPRVDDDYSGKFVVRVPKSLHRKLVSRSESEETSLNQWIVYALSEALGNPRSQALQMKHDDTSANSENFEWPGFSDAILKILQDVGYEIEAGQLDERRFSGWLEYNLADIFQLIKSGENRQALSCIKPLQEILANHNDRSPFIRLLTDLFKVQSYLITKLEDYKYKILLGEERTEKIRMLISDGIPATSSSVDISDMHDFEKTKAFESTYKIREETEILYKPETNKLFDRYKNG